MKNKYPFYCIANCIFFLNVSLVCVAQKDTSAKQLVFDSTQKYNSKSNDYSIIDSNVNNRNFNFIKKINGQFANFEVDNLENIYLITPDNLLKKYNVHGDSICVFNDVKKYGNSSLLDVSNPLKILIYYQNFSTVVILDRMFQMRNMINFRKQNIFTVNCIATSYDNNIWLFDEQDYKLKKINVDGNILLETTDWRMMMDSLPNPIKIIDHNNFVYLYDPEKGFYIFDYYGSFKNKLSFLGWKNIEVTDKFIYGFKNQTLFSYQMKSLEIKEYILPNFLQNYKEIKAINGKLYALQNDGIYIYQIN